VTAGIVTNKPNQRAIQRVFAKLASTLAAKRVRKRPLASTEHQGGGEAQIVS